MMRLERISPDRVAGAETDQLDGEITPKSTDSGEMIARLLGEVRSALRLAVSPSYVVLLDAERDGEVGR